MSESGWYDVKTEDNLNYQFFAVGNGKAQLQVKASNDARIALATNLMEAGPMYEILLGISKNTRSVIRKKRTEANKTDIKTDKLLNGNEFREFWVSWHGGVIEVGKKDDKNSFITWTDIKPLFVTFLGVSTGNGSTGLWKIKDLETDGTFTRLFYPVSKGSTSIKIKAAGNAHVVLTTGPDVLPPYYEIAIGSDNNSTMIKKVSDDPHGLTVKSQKILDADKFRGFWITWNDVILRLGREGEDKPIISLADSEPSPIFFIGIYTVGNAGWWKIEPVHGQPKIMAQSERGTCTWVKSSKGEVPVGAVIGGAEVTKEHTYVAKVTKNKKLTVGDLVPSKGSAFRINQEYEYLVLVRPCYNWVLTSGSNVPAGAVVGRKMGKDEDITYIGRVKHDNSLFTGWVHKSLGICHVAYDGKDMEFSTYEVLVF